MRSYVKDTEGKKESVGYSPARKHFPRPHESLGSNNTHDAPSTHITPKKVSMQQNVRIPSANMLDISEWQITGTDTVSFRMPWRYQKNLKIFILVAVNKKEKNCTRVEHF